MATGEKSRNDRNCAELRRTPRSNEDPVYFRFVQMVRAAFEEGPLVGERARERASQNANGPRKQPAVQFVYGSHSAIRPFRLLRPTNPLDAVRAYADAGHDAVFLAGGVDLVPAIRSGRRAGTVVWLGDMPALQEITSREDGLSIGAGVTCT